VRGVFAEDFVIDPMITRGAMPRIVDRTSYTGPSHPMLLTVSVYVESARGFTNVPRCPSQEAIRSIELHNWLRLLYGKTAQRARRFVLSIARLTPDGVIEARGTSDVPHT
jgi:hypothetical protein